MCVPFEIWVYVKTYDSLHHPPPCKMFKVMSKKDLLRRFMNISIDNKLEFALRTCFPWFNIFTTRPYLYLVMKMLANVYEYCSYSFQRHTNRNANNILHSPFSPSPFVPFPFQKSKTLYLPVFFMYIVIVIVCYI